MIDRVFDHRLTFFDMRRLLTRLSTRSPTKRFLTTIAGRRLGPERGEKGEPTWIPSISPADA